MKLLPFTFRLLMLICIVLNACKKELPASVEAQPISEITVQDARSWLKDNKPDLNLGSNWNNPVMLDVKNGNKILKVRLNETLYQKKTWVLRDVLFQRDSLGKIQAVGYKIFVDTSYFTNKVGANRPLVDKRSYINDADFTGKVVVYTLDNQAIVGWKYLNGKVQSNLLLNMSRPGQGAVAIKHPDAEPICEGGGLDDEVTCNPTGGDEPVPFDGGQNGHPLNEVPIVSTPVVPTWTYLPTNPAINTPPGSIPVGNPSGGGSSSGNTSPQISNSDIANSIYVNDGKPKISDIKKYTKCFNDGKVAKSFTMTIYVDQPVAGQANWARITMPQPGVSANNPYGLPTGINWTTPGGKTFDVGHTFVCFEKNNTDGTSVRQTLGFYPAGSSPYDSGAIKDDSGHDFDVSLKINVTLDKFNSALSKVESDFNNAQYNLTPRPGFIEYNCSDAAISWMNAAGAGLSTSGTYPFTCTPGEFGQALRSKNGATQNTGSAIIGKGPCN